MILVTAWRKRRRCFHHNWRTEDSWIKSRLIDLGMRKMFWCGHCGKTWIP